MIYLDKLSPLALMPPIRILLDGMPSRKKPRVRFIGLESTARANETLVSAFTTDAKPVETQSI